MSQRTPIAERHARRSGFFVTLGTPVSGLGRAPPAPRWVPAFLVLTLLVMPTLCGTHAAAAEEPDPPPVFHKLTIVLHPDTHELTATDVLDFGGDVDATVKFVLHADLAIELRDGAHWRLESLDSTAAGRSPTELSGEMGAAVPLRAYRLVPLDPPAGGQRARPVLQYHGVIHHPLGGSAGQSARGTASTPGIIAADGVFLCGATYWVPTFPDRMVRYDLRTPELPEGWTVVSAGERVGDRWIAAQPMDEVYLVGGPLHEISRQHGDLTISAYLREPDTALAARYHDATVQYVEMFSRMLGPYPYKKFALVENFWETGYGMPSFTLLGPRVIRLPFILHSSYPHEILHNWWGNSVYVDHATGNWCEGLTAYLADHLIKEGRGQGADYRRETLARYRDFVSAADDIALTEFRSRHSPATQAVGYGKGTMVWHMLRRQVDDLRFVRGLRSFYEEHRFQRASYTDLRHSMEWGTGEDLEWFFKQWVERAGAPELSLGKVELGLDAFDNKIIRIEIQQLQPGAPYRLQVPVALTLPGQERAQMALIFLEAASREVEIRVPDHPLRVALDPSFDLFRRLDRSEIPSSIAQLLGADRATIVLPAPGEEPTTRDWVSFAERWRAASTGEVEVVTADALTAFPEDRSVWVLGAGNRWGATVARHVGARLALHDDQHVSVDGKRFPEAAHSFVMTARTGGTGRTGATEGTSSDDQAVGWITCSVDAAIPGLARKLPHYGKYSWLAFQGDEPENVGKGQWSPGASSLVRVLAGGEGVAAGTLPEEHPLARPRPVYDRERLLAHVRVLAADELEGRGAGSAGLDRAAAYIEQQFEQVGLQAGGDLGADGARAWTQSWSQPDGPTGEPVTLRNVVGVLRGRKPEWAAQSIIVGAHYDHLGRGWPDVHSGDEGQIHNGADDNASGVSVLIELARQLARTRPDRTVIFVAFSGEEWGLKGSKHFIASAREWPVSGMMAMLNLDSVGRLGDRKLLLLGSSSAREWTTMARFVGFSTGVETQPVRQDPGGSDQRSFHEVGVPALQLFAGPHDDYHRPSDDVDRIDVTGMGQSLLFLEAAVGYLAAREEPLTVQLAGARKRGPSSDPSSSSGERPRPRPSLGTTPDFAFGGPGVRVESVRAESPAQVAGILPGDVIVAIDGESIADLLGFSQLLRAHSPGDEVQVRVLRDGEELTLNATLRAR